MHLVTAAQMRDLDRLTIEEYGVPGHVLMERAGAGACAMLLKVFPHLRKKGARVVVVAGKGNNGGDGFVVSRLLRRKGIRVSVLLMARCAQLGGDAERNLRAFRRGRTVVREITTQRQVGKVLDELRGADCIVDALLGTGVQAAVRPLQAAMIEAINTCGTPVFALDLPSGLDADRGVPLGTAIRAEATATFGFAKLGQVIHPGIEHCGELGVVDIGIDARALAQRPPTAMLMSRGEASRLLPRRAADAHKGSAGHVLVIAGSRGKSGAAVLATRAALRAGVGLVTLAIPSSLHQICAASVPEAMTELWPEKDGAIDFERAVVERAVAGKAAVVVGPGLGTTRAVRRTVHHLLRRADLPLVLDADALNVLAGDPGRLRRAGARVVVTPHPGEMARLAACDTAGVQADRVGVARHFATARECVTVLKGARTVVAAADGMIAINPTGNPGMASGGMGDALAGIIGALSGQGLCPFDAARLGVYVHGLAADRAAAAGAIGLIASDVIDGVPAALRESDELLG